jgi:transposase
MPPSLDELVGPTHPVRFVAAFIESLEDETWAAMGIEVEGDALGRPGYDPRMLTGVWMYGFMSRVRSCRQLERACQEQLPFLWLSSWQHPDHNTLWRFYKQHREQMRGFLQQTVRLAVRAGLVNFAVQAVDGTKVRGNASIDQTHDDAGLERLLERTNRAIVEMEAQNSSGEEPPPPHLPAELASKQALLERVRRVREELTQESGTRPQVNLTDADAKLMKSRQGFVAGYNAQAMVAPLQPEVSGATGMLITAADVSCNAKDTDQLVPMVKQAEENTGRQADLLLADAGYHSGPNLSSMAMSKQAILMPENQQRALTGHYHKAAFVYHPETDTYSCPQGQLLHFAGTTTSRGRPVRRYRSSPAVCLSCPVVDRCTRDRRHGRSLTISDSENQLRAHRQVMETKENKLLYRQRQQLVEPVFGLLKVQQGCRQFLLRGLANVRAEWCLLAAAFNLRTLANVWRLQVAHS